MLHLADFHGDMRWELDQGATRYNVTHLACRSARYTPATAGGACSLAYMKQAAFPVALCICTFAFVLLFHFTLCALAAGECSS